MFESLQTEYPNEFGAVDNSFIESPPGGEEDLIPSDSPPSPPDFYENLAEKMSSEKLNTLASKLTDAIEDDLKSRKGWEDTISLGMKYLGTVVEEFRAKDSFKGSAAFDSTMATALYGCYSAAIAELYPASGPARSEVVGIPTSETEQQGERVKLWINYFLTIIDEAYYPDSIKNILYAFFYGCSFKKVYQDPILKRPCARLVKPQDLIINNNTTSLMESDRITERLYLNRRQVLTNQRNGVFIEFDLGDDNDDNAESKSSLQAAVNRVDGVQVDSGENRSMYKFYVSHTDITSDEVDDDMFSPDDDIPKPYRVTIDTSTNKVVSVIRNWKENDEECTRINIFVQYQMLPGFGLYSVGIAHSMGSDSIALTTCLRQTLDAAAFHNYPGGLRAKQAGAENNNALIRPGEFREVETNGLPISDCFMNMPYNEPSQVIVGLMEIMKKSSLDKISSAQTQIPNIGANAPSITALATLEVSGRPQSTVLRSFHNSLGIELRLLFDLFGEHLPDEPYPFSVPGKETAIMRSDFSDRVRVVPVSDPNAITSTHRLVQNEALMRIAQTAPQLHDMREVLFRLYTSMNVENVEKILPPQPQPMPLDPVSENMLMLSGQRAMVAMFQDDDSHNIVHGDFLQSPIMQTMMQAAPDMYAKLLSEVTLHMKVHDANKAFKEIQMMQQQQGMQVQPVSQEQEQQIPMIPEIQNTVAAQAAEQVIKKIQDMAEQQKAAAEAQIDPNRVMVYEIEQRAEQAKAQAEIDLQELAFKEQEVKLKTEAEAFKAQLRFESEKSKMEIQQQMASEKNQVDLAIEASKREQSEIENRIKIEIEHNRLEQAEAQMHQRNQEKTHE
jgi:hypothetical protein